MPAVEQQALYVDHMGNDLSVVRAAKVSFADNETVQEFITDIKAQGSDCKSHEALIRYLATHHHWTPFAHTAITLRVRAPIPIRTQCFKHKVGFVENEESRRYINSSPDYFVPVWRKSVENKKQGSGENFSVLIQNLEDSQYKNHVLRCIEEYEDALERGICEEQARLYLPQGCVVNWYWTGSLAAFARMYKQRTDPHAQVEIQELAKLISKAIQPLFPVSWKALVGDV